MQTFKLLAEPWWVNLLILIPLWLYFVLGRRGFGLRRITLVYLTIFGASFGVVEAAVVVYLRAAVGLLPGYTVSFAEIFSKSASFYQQPLRLTDLPGTLLAVEVAREAYSMLILFSVAVLSAKKNRVRVAAFLWAFAFWDIFYYAGLWAIIRWPGSLLTRDVLFLIPTPWYSQVWFPLLVSSAIVFAIAARAVNRDG
jgi:hypothetical protein